MTDLGCQRSLCALLSAFPKNNGLKKGIKPDTICCNTVFTGFKILLKEIDTKKLKPVVRTYRKTMAPLCAQGKTSDAEELPNVMSSDGIEPNRISLMHGFRKEENMKSAMQVFSAPAATSITFQETDLTSEETSEASSDRIKLGNMKPAAATRFTFEEADLASEERLWALYDRWLSHHGVTRSSDEKRWRFDVFRAKANYVYEFNKKGKPYVQGLNQFGDMTKEEIKRKYTGLNFTRVVPEC